MASATAAGVGVAASVWGKALTAIGTLFASASAASKTLRATALVVVGLCTVAVSSLALASPKLRHRLFWPGMNYPESPQSDLLPGSLGCPFMGSPWIYTSADPSYGAGHYYRKASAALGATLGRVPKIWKYYIFGKAFCVLSGGKTFQKVLNMEFDTLTSSGVDLMEGGLMATESLLFERNKKRHSYLRRLVGAALTPSAVAKAAPTLQSAAEEQVSRMLEWQESSGSNYSNTDSNSNSNSNDIKFHQVCTDYTLEVAWRQILGLELSEEEIPVFEENVAAWIAGIMSLRVVLKIGVESSPGYASREYVIQKIEEKIDQLLANGPDHTSTLSGMVFATDDETDTENDTTEGKGKKLSRKEIIDNALILIFAGSETSASTLTNAMLFLGLHPDVWDRLVEEQQSLQQEHGDDLTIGALDASNAPYLDAVLKETMRVRTVVGGIPRTALEDIDVDGDGKTIIPKGFMINPSLLLTHEEDPSTKLPNGMHLDAIQGFRPERWLAANANTGMSTNGNDSGNHRGEEHQPKYEKPNPDWYVPYGFGPRYCLGKHLAQLEMKVFLATLARKLDFPKLTMLPEGYDYSSTKKDPDATDYFSVEWSTRGAVIPTASDGVLASVASASNSNNVRNSNTAISTSSLQRQPETETSPV